MKDLRIEIVNQIKKVEKSVDEFGKLMPIVKRNYVGNHGAFKLVATDLSDYDGMEVTICISSHRTWTSAEKAFNMRLSSLDSIEKTKAQQFLIEIRDEAIRIQSNMKRADEKIASRVAQLQGTRKKRKTK